MTDQHTPPPPPGINLSDEVLSIAVELDRLEPVARAALLSALRVELLRMRIRGRVNDGPADVGKRH